MRIAVAGTGALAASLLRPLLTSGHDVAAIVQNGRRTKGIKRFLLPPYLHLVGGAATPMGIAHRHGIPIVFLDRMVHDLEPLRACKPDVLLVGGFDIILKRPLLDLPAIGCVNFHSSLLPKHRGPNPFSWVLLANDRETGVTFHVMEEGIDTGPVLDQTAFPIGPRDTALSLHAKACEAATDRVVDVMDAIEANGLDGTPQDHGAATYDRKLTKDDARIDWSLPAEEIDRRVRALNLYASRFDFRGRTICVRRTGFDKTPVSAEPGTVLTQRPPVRVATGQGVLVLEVAYATWPVPTAWPVPWNRPKPGEKVS